MAEKAELKQQLPSKEAELTRAQETIRREQQQNRVMREKVQEMEQEMEEMKLKIEEMEKQLATFSSRIIEPSHLSATVNQTTHVLIELRDSSGRLCSLQQNVTAQLQLISEASTPTSSSETSDKTHINADITYIPPSQYKVEYKAENRGLHNLHVFVNNREINGSPFIITVYPYPTQLVRPVRVVTGLNRPYGIAVNSRGEMIVSECKGHQISIFDSRGKKVRTFGSYGDSREQMIEPAGIAVDKEDNIYVSSLHKLQKFTRSGELIECVGQEGSGDDEFNDPRGVTIYNDKVYVCDHKNKRIQVFNLDLKCIRSIKSGGKGNCEFKAPYDVKLDAAGSGGDIIYIAEYNNERVQVMDNNEYLLRTLSENLNGPTALHIVDKYMYVSDFNGHCIVVYETSGQFVTKFGKLGNMEGEFSTPYCITSCANGFIYVCDWSNDRVQIF